MGGICSRIMDFVCKPDFILILRYCARRFYERIYSLRDDEDEELCYSIPQRNIPVPDTNRLNNHDVSLTIKQDCGIPNTSGKQNLSVTSMIQKRVIKPGFSTPEKCWLNNNYLPNRFDVQAHYGSKVFCSLHSADGKFCLTACQDKYLRIYHSYNSRFVPLKEMLAQDVGWSILDTAFSPDGTAIVYSSWSECLYQCSVSDESDTHIMLSLNPHIRQFCIFSLAFSQDGYEILGGANDGYVYLYDRECNKRVLRFPAHDVDINSVVFADDSSQIFYSGGDDGVCKVWDKRMLSRTDSLPVGVFSGHIDGITYIDSRRDGRYLITNSKDQSIKLWDVRVLASPSACRDIMYHNWDYRWQNVPRQLQRPRRLLESDTSIMTYRGHCVLKTLIRCRFSPAETTGQRYIYTGCSTGRIFIYDVLTGKVARVLYGHSACVRDVSWHPTLPYIISSSWDNRVAKWQYRSSDRYTDPENESRIV